MICTDDSVTVAMAASILSGINIACLVGNAVAILLRVRHHTMSLRAHGQLAADASRAMRADLESMREMARRLEVARHNAVRAGLDPDEVLSQPHVTVSDLR